jgi:8-oxo-dGTP diphosphatase
MADLTGFPRPSVAVDVAVCTVIDDALSMLLWRRTGSTATGEWALPGSFVRERERLDDAVARTLRDKCGVVGLAPTQLRVMDDPARDDRGWVLSVAHLDVVAPDALGANAAEGDVRIVRVHPGEPKRGRSLLELPDRQRRLPFDHEAIASVAIEELRHRYLHRPDPAGLLDARFTMLQLRRLHEAIAGEPLQKDTFRRAMAPHLEETDEVEQGVVGRPPRLFSRAALLKGGSTPIA